MVVLCCARRKEYRGHHDVQRRQMGTFVFRTLLSNNEGPRWQRPALGRLGASSRVQSRMQEDKKRASDWRISDRSTVECWEFSKIESPPDCFRKPSNACQAFSEDKPERIQPK